MAQSTRPAIVYERPIYAEEILRDYKYSLRRGCTATDQLDSKEF
jgi:hypothetical protein